MTNDLPPTTPTGESVMDIIERAARALALVIDGTDKNWKEFVAEVLAVLEAIREPDEGMIEAGCLAVEDADGTFNDGMAAGWQAMIDQALKG